MKHVLPTVVLALFAIAAPASAAPRPAWESDVRGPQPLTPAEKLAAAVDCTPDVATAAKPPVLLVHGTAINQQETYGWNLLEVLPAEGYPTCTVTLPNRALTDMQTSVEYVVYAIRRVSDRAARRIAVIGHSQGTLLLTYALKFWPDVQRRVDDMIGLASGTERGTDIASVLCATPLVCTDALRQFPPGSKLLQATARVANPAGPSYTGILTLTDGLLGPQPEASTLHAPGARNYVLQDLCPGSVENHGTMLGNATVVALVRDALAHPGTADDTRIGTPGCGQIPGTTPSNLAAPAGIVAAIATESPKHPSTAEPTLRCYLEGTCADPTPLALRLRCDARRRRLVVRVEGDTTQIRTVVLHMGERLARTVTVPPFRLVVGKRGLRKARGTRRLTATVEPVGTPRPPIRLRARVPRACAGKGGR